MEDNYKIYQIQELTTENFDELLLWTGGVEMSEMRIYLGDYDQGIASIRDMIAKVHSADGQWLFMAHDKTDIMDRYIVVDGVVYDR